MQNKPSSDLLTRTLTALGMVAILAVVFFAAASFGYWIFQAFIILIGLGCLYEWWGLISKFTQSGLKRGLWMLVGVMYIGAALGAFFAPRYYNFPHGFLGVAYLFYVFLYAELLLNTLITVIVVDIAGYIFGRLLGGKKIWPRISPGKTWSGTIAGLVFGTLTPLCFWYLANSYIRNMHLLIIFGFLISIAAQAGDVFESWLKRKAQFKDSGKILLSHGGLLDRLDGHLAALIVMQICFFLPLLTGL
jgi:phosphatidate cytidylyltransferase